MSVVFARPPQSPRRIRTATDAAVAPVSVCRRNSARLAAVIGRRLAPLTQLNQRRLDENKNKTKTTPIVEEIAELSFEGTDRENQSSTVS